MITDNHNPSAEAGQHNHRALFRRIGASAAVVGVLAVAGCTPTSSQTAAPSSTTAGPTTNLPAGDMSNGAANFYTSDRVTVEPVTFKNQYGMNVSGNLFMPKNIDRNTTNPAIVVGHPMGAVKQQSANLYATKMAERGFVTMSLDLSFWGHSDGQPRNAVSPDIYAEDFSAAVDFLRTQSFVDRERIGALGICGSGSFVISAAKIDPRIKSQPTATGCATPSPSISAARSCNKPPSSATSNSVAARPPTPAAPPTNSPTNPPRWTGSSTTSTAPPAATAPTPPPSRR